MLRFHHKKHKTYHKHKDGKSFAILALIVGVANSAFLTIFPLILENILKSEEKVGYYFSAISVICLLFSIFSTYIFSKFSKIKITKYTFITGVLTLLGLTFAKNFYQFIIFDIIRACIFLTIWICLSLFISDFSKKLNIASNEGRYYFFTNIGWLIGPIIAGLLAKYFGYESMFIFTSLMLLIGLIYFLKLQLKEKYKFFINKKHNETITELIINIKNYFTNKELRKVFLIAFGLNIWAAISSLYTPIYIKNLGYKEDVIGIVITLMIVPLLLFENFVGNLANKKGVKKLLIFGFLVLSIGAFFIPLFKSSAFVFLWFIIIEIGTSLIEPLQETYYFNSVRPKNKSKFFGIYNTADPVANITAPLLASFFIMTMNIDFLWTGFSFVMFLFVIIASTIKKNK